jgi:ParB-like chromosome segregation protein Spo0J
MNMAGSKIHMENAELEDITVLPGRRHIDQNVVEEIAQSIELIGLQHPITARFVADYVDPQTGEIDSAYILVEGHHRLEAVRRLGHTHIPCRVMMEWTERQARMWEISENLHRADLNVLEESEQITEWMRLAGDEPDVDEPEVVLAQVGPKIGRGRPAGGERAAVRKLGIKRTSAQRAKMIADIEPEAKKAAIEAGFADKQSKLLKIASKPKDQQVSAVRELAKKKPKGAAEGPANKSSKQQAANVIEFPGAQNDKEYTLEDAYNELRAIARKLSPADCQRLGENAEDIIEEIYLEMKVTA